MNRRQVVVAMMFSSLLGGLVAVFIVLQISPNIFSVNEQPPYESIENRQQVKYSYEIPEYKIPDKLDFTAAANEVIPGVVHIKALYNTGDYSVNPLNGFYHNPARSSGSGVIVSDDGYIVTNNHVIEDAELVEVVLFNNQSFRAKVIGVDPTTDLALVKINAYNLPFVKYGNSDEVLPGEWVLAIGNPFELNSTVTAGIVSAKARNIGILKAKNNLQIESFIQTDAAVNPGNSGGALVNLQGELIGINTAIATPTGTYAGYSFAVPVTLVKKVMDDLLMYGRVQRGLLGIKINDVDAFTAEQFDLTTTTGIFVTYVNENSAAEEAGIMSGDVIIAINDIQVTNVSELQEMVARYRPGDEVLVTYLRGDSEQETTAILKDTEGKSEVTPREYDDTIKGALFEDLTSEDLIRYNIDGGVRIDQLSEGPWSKAGIKVGFIVTAIDKVNINDIADLNRILELKSGSFLVEGIYPDGKEAVYGVNWD